MPPVIIAAAAVAGAGAVAGGVALAVGFSGIVASGIFFAGLELATNVLIAGAGNFLLGKIFKPKMPSGPTFTTEARDRLQMFRSSIANRRMIYGEVKVSGPLVFASSTGTKHEFLHMIIPLAEHEVDSIGDVYLGDKLSTDTKFSGLVRITKHLGTDTQAADANTVADVEEWTDAHTLSGVAYLAVRLKWDQNVWVSGIPNITAVVRGKKAFDPRTSTTVWSDNPALCIRDYLTSPDGFGLTSAEVDDTAVTTAANICDELVADGQGGTQKRYTLNGSVDLGDTPSSIMEGMLTSMAGALTFTQGVYRMFAGAYVTPTVTLTESDLRGEIKVSPHLSRKDLFNGVRGVYVDPSKNWQPGDFPPVTNATYEAQDGGQQIMRDIQLPYTTDGIMAQRLAKIHLEKSRQGVTCSFPAKLTALQLAVMDTVSVTVAQLGWSAKVFRIMQWQPSQDGGIDLTMQEEAAGSYAWNNGDPTLVDPAPNTNLPDPFTVASPINLSVTESLYQTTNSAGVKAKATITWEAAQADAASYAVEYKPTADSVWLSAGTVHGGTTSMDILDVAPAQYDFRVLATSFIGVNSAWSTITQTITGLSAVPSDVTGLSARVNGSSMSVTWDRPADLDVLIGGFLLIRHTPKTASAIWQDGIDLVKVPASATAALVPLLAGTYMAKYIDSSGFESANAVIVSPGAAALNTLNVVATVTEDPAFSGVKTNVIAIDSQLKLLGGMLWDSVPGNIDDWGDIDSLGGIQSSGTYEFTDVFDLGAIYNNRLSAAIDVTVGFGNNMVDSWGDVDSLADIDGLTGGILAGVVLEIATTNDDPAGAPAWSAWAPFVFGDYQARAFKFRLRFSSQDVNTNAFVTGLSVTIDMPDRVEAGNAVAIPAGGLTITFANAFRVTPAIGITVQTATAGDTPTLTAPSNTGFTVQILDAGGAGVARTIDWQAKGYGRAA